MVVQVSREEVRLCNRSGVTGEVGRDWQPRSGTLKLHGSTDHGSVGKGAEDGKEDTGSGANLASIS